MIDLATALAAAGITTPIILTAVYFLSKSLLNHRFAVALEAHKTEFSKALEETRSSLQRDAARESVLLEGQARRTLELELGTQAAERQYALEARRRLYLAVGPLRFQLLLACRDCSSRISAHGRHERYEINVASYYGQSTLYRLLRPLALVELIERQISFFDFSVDKEAVDCLRLKKAFLRSLSGDEIVCGHPNVNWDDQIEHVYADAAIAGSSALILQDGATARVMRFDEFVRVIKGSGAEPFEPFPNLIRALHLEEKPILWLRLVAYGYYCDRFVSHSGKTLGFATADYPLTELLAAAEDPYILREKARYLAAIEANALPQL